MAGSNQTTTEEDGEQHSQQGPGRNAPALILRYGSRPDYRPLTSTLKVLGLALSAFGR